MNNRPSEMMEMFEHQGTAAAELASEDYAQHQRVRSSVPGRHLSGITCITVLQPANSGARQKHWDFNLSHCRPCIAHASWTRIHPLVLLKVLTLQALIHIFVCDAQAERTNAVAFNNDEDEEARVEDSQDIDDDMNPSVTGLLLTKQVLWHCPYIVHFQLVQGC